MPYKKVNKKCANPLCSYVGPIRKDIKFHSRACYDSWVSVDKARFLSSLVGVDEPDLVVHGNCMLANDWHIPYTDPDMVRYMLAIADKFDINQLAIGGDIFNADALKSSHAPRLALEVPFDQELAATERIFNILLDHFDNIYCCFGNHDERVLGALKGSVTGEQLGKLFLPSSLGHLLGDRVFVTARRYLTLETNGKEFRYTHPANYSRNAPTVERALAEKFNTNLLSTHGHLFAVGFDRSGRHIVAQLGCMLDNKNVPYVQIVDTTHPVWNRGFGMLYNGYLYTFAEGLTDWNFWLGDQINPNE